MEDRVFKIKLFLYDEPQYDDINFFQNDTKTCTLDLEFYKNKKEKYDLSNSEVVIIIKKNSGADVIDRVLPVNGVYRYELPNNAIDNNGNNKVTIQVIGKNQERVTFGTFKYKLSKDIDTGNIADATDYPILVSLISEAITVLAGEKLRVDNEKLRVDNEFKRIANENYRKDDYESLKKIIINENQAADLQNQININNNLLSEKAEIVIGDIIPAIENRKNKALYFKITETQSSNGIGGSTLKVSPNMGLKLV